MKEINFSNGINTKNGIKIELPFDFGFRVWYLSEVRVNENRNWCVASSTVEGYDLSSDGEVYIYLADGQGFTLGQDTVYATIEEAEQALKVVSEHITPEEANAKRLVELEDKIKNGTLIELPCAVGTTVFKVTKNCLNCQHMVKHFFESDEYETWGCEYNFKEFVIDEKNPHCLYYLRKTEFELSMLQDFGKTVYLTKETALADWGDVIND